MKKLNLLLSVVFAGGLLASSMVNAEPSTTITFGAKIVGAGCLVEGKTTLNCYDAFNKKHDTFEVKELLDKGVMNTSIIHIKTIKSPRDHNKKTIVIAYN